MKKVIATFKQVVHLPTKDFKDLVKTEIELTLAEFEGSRVPTLDCEYNPIQFEAKYPEYIYQEALKLYPDEFEKKPFYNESGTHSMDQSKGKTRVIRHSVAQAVLEELNSISSKIVTHHTLKDVHGDKMLFIRFNGSTEDQRDMNFGAGMGILNSIQFQYFIGYKYVGKGQQWHNKEIETEKYESYYKHGLQRNGMHSDDELVPLHRTPKELEQLKYRYLIIPYSEEREIYLKEIQKTFTTITERLNDFLKDLNAEKLDHLIATSPVMKMLQAPESN